MVRINATVRSVRKNLTLYLLLTPVLTYYLLFHYLPMAGIVVSFKDFMPRKGIWQSQWVGLKYFRILFGGADFPMVMRNTIVISLMRLILEFPAPILLALHINEVRSTSFKRVVQTAVYMPHFLSWVIVGSLVTMMVEQGGPIHQLTMLLGSTQSSSLLLDKGSFYPILIVSSTWKEIGWGTLIYMAALSGISPELYESAVIDGAGRFKQMLHITLPSLQSTIIVLLILRTGSILNAGFEQILLLMNSMTRSVAEIIDTYVYKMGIERANYAIATAAGLFKSVVSLLMVLLANKLAQKFGDSSLL